MPERGFRSGTKSDRELANRRVASLYEESNQAGIKYNKVFFE